MTPSRWALWRAALALARERPWLGWGPDSYRWLYGQRLGLAWWDQRVYANNLLLELAATTGLLGLAAATLLGGVVLARGGAALRRLHGAGPALAAALALLVVVVVHGLVDYFLEFTAGYVPVWGAVGMVAGLARSEDAEG